MMQLYGHPFSSFTWKVLIALYERALPFDFRMVDPGHPDNSAMVADAGPGGQFPVLIDGDRTVIESSAIIEYLEVVHGSAGHLVPADPVRAIEARQMDALLDDYIAAPVQAILDDAARSEGERDAPGAARARERLEKAYAWFDRWMEDRDWAACGRFTIADCVAAPALFYADWVHEIAEGHANLRAYRQRLLARPTIARVIDEARPYRHLFPLGAPGRD